MKHTLSTAEAIRLLMADENARWSFEAARALVEYYEEAEEANGAEIEFDRVAIRCEWDEYRTAQDVAEAYDIPCEDPEDLDETVVGHISRRSEILTLPDRKGYLVRAF